MDARLERWQRRFFAPVTLAAVLTVPLLVVETHDVSATIKTRLEVADWIVWGIFALEAVTLFAVAPSKSNWVKDNVLDLAIVAVTLPVIPAAVQGLRLLRLLRLFRLARLAPVARRVFSLAGLRYASFLALLAMLAGGEAFSVAENAGPSHHVSLSDGIYWALSTMTTVGYGDFVPRTTTGKIVAAVVMVVGVAFFAMITGAIAQRFLATEVQEIEEEMVEVEEMVHEAEQTEQRVEAGQGQILQEIHELAERLQSLEERLRGQFGTR
jgi:voltage-gated potassium channel